MEWEYVSCKCKIDETDLAFDVENGKVCCEHCYPEYDYSRSLEKLDSN
jgi:hypothetical protein